MWHKYATTVGLALALLCLVSTLVFAQDQGGGDTPVSTGVVAVITTLDAKTGLVTLKTEAGEVFELPQERRWKVGDKVMCDRIEAGRRSQFQDCKLWESAHEAGAAPARKERPTSSK